MIDEKELEKIRKDVEEEFPEDYALQQVHIARKILSLEAKQKGLSLLEYIKAQRKEIKHAEHGV